MPARAIVGAAPNADTPARANVPPKTTVRSPARAILRTTPTVPTPARTLAHIRALADLLDDIQLLRIANGNRIGALEREYGSSLPHMDLIQKQLDVAEHQATLELQRAWRKHPLAPWAKSIPGCGEKLIARLIAIVGDPAERENVAKLWAYCGHGNPALSGIPKGATQAEMFRRGNPDAKKAVWKLAYQFMRTVGSEIQPRSPYRDVYEQRKEQTEGRLHQRDCRRCGPAGHPAKTGSPWSDAHRHADALRVVGKVFLKDLWVESNAVRVGVAA